MIEFIKWQWRESPVRTILTWNSLIFSWTALLLCLWNLLR
jgi:hypothetical protein